MVAATPAQVCKELCAANPGSISTPMKKMLMAAPRGKPVRMPANRGLVTSARTDRPTVMTMTVPILTRVIKLNKSIINCMSRRFNHCCGTCRINDGCVADRETGHRVRETESGPVPEVAPASCAKPRRQVSVLPENAERAVRTSYFDILEVRAFRVFS